MVSNQAANISWPTCQRTPLRRCAAPAPMMLELITWVRLTGPPRKAAPHHTQPAELGSEAVHRSYLHDPSAQCANHTPAAERRAQCHPGRRGHQDPAWHTKFFQLPGGQKTQHKNAHGFLGIVGSMPECKPERCKQLQPLKGSTDARCRASGQEKNDAGHQIPCDQT